MEIPRTTIKSVKDGTHDATIKDVSYRMDPYNYTDITYHLEDVDVDIKDGCPSKLSFNDDGEPKSKLATLMVALDAVGKEAGDPDKLKGIKVTLMTLNEKTDKGTFARVVDGSIKLRK